MKPQATESEDLYVMPMSFAQQRMWLLAELEHNHSHYNIVSALHLQGRLNQQALQNAIDCILDRHEVLRTAFATVDDEPSQIIQNEARITIETVSLLYYPEAQRQAEAISRAEKLAQTVLPLDQWPLMKVVLFQLAEDRHILVAVVHHIIADGWSMGIFAQELAAFYQSECEDKGESSVTLPELDLQYADFALWQRDWLAGEEKQRLLTFWRQQLDGLPPLLTLATDYARPPVKQYTGDHLAAHIPPELATQLRQLQKQQDASLYMVLLTAYFVLLHLYSGQQDIAVGSPIANRTREELEPLIGLFVNTLVLRGEVKRDQSFRQLLQATIHRAMAAYDHQDLPFEMLVEALQVERNLSTTPLFQAFFVLQNAQSQSLTLPGLTLNPVDIPKLTSMFDLTLAAIEQGEGIALQWEFDTSLFKLTSIQRMSETYLHLLHLMVEAADTPLSQLALCSAADREFTQRSLLKPDNAPQQNAQGLLQPIAQQVQQQPDSIAVTCGLDTLTYQELWQYSDQFAVELLEAGVQPGDRVALCLSQSVELVIALLGILKVRGVYVPIDSRYPKNRIQQMLLTVLPRVIVADSKSTLFTDTARILSVDRCALASVIVPEPFDLTFRPDDGIYIIFTSGSTGIPKGAQVLQRGFNNLMQWFIDTHQLSATDSTLLISSLSFDLSQKNLFAPLMAGGRLHLLSGEYDPEQIRQLIAQHRITWLNATPSAFYPIIETADAQFPLATKLQSLRYVFLGGEPIALNRLSAWLAAPRTQTKIVNTYGPTECTDICAAYEVKQLAEENTVVPLGSPINAVHLYVFDDHLQPVPVGVPGQLCIGGVGVGAGYVGEGFVVDRQLTDAKFLMALPRGIQERVYLTGDRVKLNHQGLLEFIGRMDHGVKIRGFRVDPSEIETVLEACPIVAQAVVIARETDNEKDLAAYCVVKEKPMEDQAEKILRAWLADHLPYYMVPRYLMLLDSLPLNANGKVDRKALPAPQAKVTGAMIPPQSGLEKTLAACWQEILGIERVGRSDDFFALGGHSLLAAKLANRLKQPLKSCYPRHRLSLRDLFEAPTIAALAELIESRSANDPDPAIAPCVAQRDAQRPEKIPLSLAQQRLWFIDRYEGANALYNMPYVIQLTGALDVQAMTAAMRQLVARHELLRACFAMEKDEPYQIIRDVLEVVIPLEDVSAIADDRERLMQQIQHITQQPFDLDRAPLWRCKLLKLNARQHIWVVVLHHAIADGWSLGILMQEFADLYNGQPLKEQTTERLQYSDYAIWQRRSAEYRREMALHLDYWQSQLADIPDSLALPTDFARPARQQHRGKLHSFELDAGLVRQLNAFGQAHQCTLFMTLFSAYAILLSRYAGQDDLVIGIPTSGRDQPALESVVGFFVNSLPIRVRGIAGLSLTDALSHIRQSLLTAYDHQQASFDQIVSRLPIERKPSHTPVYQVMFSLQHSDPTDIHLNGLSIELIEEARVSAKYDLTLSLEEQALSEQANTYRAHLEYDSDLFTEKTIETLAERYCYLLRSFAAAHAAQQVNTLPLESFETQSAWLSEWNATATDYPRDQSLMDLFARQVARRPDAIAVNGEVNGQAQQLTYKELDRQATQMAAQLQQLGVEQGDFVALYLERSVEQIVAMLAVIKAGAAYVPIDLSYPLERIRYMLADSRACLLLTMQSQLQAQPALSDLKQSATMHPALQIITLEALEKTPTPLAAINTTAANTSAQAGDLAYVIYTSGSTGKPKGVAVTHRAINRLVLQTNYIQITPEDIIAQASNTAFDAATFEIWGALLNGAALQLVPRDIQLAPLNYAAFLKEKRISILFLTTALFNQILREAPDAFAPLRVLLFGGELVDPHWVKTALSFGKPQHLLHVYGPTENTTFSTYYEVTELASNAATIPIGRPLSNTQCYMLDEQKQVVPPGIAGELYLGGDGLAQGYLNREALTAEKFVPHPLPGHEHERLYRTGDLVRCNHQGDIEFIGRIDQQVKIRGLRVELGEIHTALLKHEAVSEAAVIVVPDATGVQQIAAYVVTVQADEKYLTQKALKQFLKSRLPGFMIPAAIVFLEELPLNANGKVEKAKLPEPFGQVFEEQAAMQQPVTETEQAIYNAWAEILPVKQFDREDNFFELGGHSLMATQVVSRLCEKFGLEISIRHFFEKPTVAALALHIDQLTHLNAALPIQRHRRDLPIPLSFAQQRLWLMAQIEGANPTYNVPTALRLRGSLNIDALEQAFSQVIARHEILRTCFVEEAGQPVQKIAAPVPFKLTIVNLGSYSEAEKQRRLTREMMALAEWPFDLSRLPLLIARLLILNDEDEDAVLMVNIHHIISDGWSMGILVNELTAAYSAAVERRELSLPALTYQYADYAVWQRRYLSGRKLKALSNYWRQQLQGLPPLLEIPTDKPRPPQMSYRGESLTFQIDSNTRQQLKALCQQTGATLFMALLACYGSLLSRYSGQDDIAIGTTIANRNQTFTEPMIGFFVNTLVLRVQPAQDSSFRQLLQQVKNTCLAAYDHQDMPFEQLVEVLQPERNLSHTPLFQAMLMLQNAPAGEMQLSDLTVEPVALNNRHAHFDLNMSLTETADGLQGIFEFRTDLFDRSTIERLLRHFVHLVQQAAAQPDQALASLSLLSPSEYRQIINEWNDTAADYDRNTCIHKLFEQRVKQQPDAPALVYRQSHRQSHQQPDQQSQASGDVVWSYQQLNDRANQLAHHLIELGVGPEKRVGVFLERSIEMVVALLAIVKAGGAYIPIHHTWPVQRARHILQDQQARVLITHSHQWAKACEIVERSDAAMVTDLICLDDLSDDSAAIVGDARDARDARDLREVPDNTACNVWRPQQLIHYAKEDPKIPLSSENTAYIIFTSGSTGTPKGVVLKHRPVVNLIEWVNKTFNITPADCLLFVTSMCFDLSVYDIFGILASGASLRIATETDLDNPENLARYLESGEITFWDSAPAALQQLTPLFHATKFHTTKGEGVNALRLVFLSGDWIPLTLPDTLRQPFPQAQVVSLGGATEAAIWSNFHVIDEVKTAWSSIPYGRPIQNARYYVLDAYLNPCPIGVAGELHIGGECLANGYTSAKQSADRFIPDPFSAMPGTMYKTGDLARFWEDGTIEILGRLDHQIKLRGYRIETGEIESVLVAQPDITKALVILREDTPGLKQLVAYVIPVNGTVYGEHEVFALRQALKEKLPDYMIPAAIISLTELPITANGKVDRNALPAPDKQAQRSLQLPQTDLEKQLCAIWQFVLHLEQVGATDNFFDLGGDSIVSIQLVARAREQGLKVLARHIFQFQTIAELAPHVQRMDEEAANDAGSMALDGNIPLTPIQHWFFEQAFAKPHHFNQSFLFRILDPVDCNALEQAVQAIVAHHPALRLAFEKTPQGWRQQVTEMERIAPVADYYRRIDIDSDHFDKPIEQACAAVQSSLCLSEPPLLRVILFNLTAIQECRIFIVFHHLIIDGVSWRIVLQDLETAYRHFKAAPTNTALGLPPEQTGFHSWACALQDYAEQPAVQGELDFWVSRFAGQAVTRLPVDHQTDEGNINGNTVSSTQTVSTRLSEQATKALLNAVPKAYNTQINDLLLTALWLTLSEWTRASEVLVEMEGHGREEVLTQCDVSRTVGWFTSLYPVLLCGDEKQKDLASSIKEIKEQLRQIPQQGFHYGLLRYLNSSDQARQTLGSLPQAEISFNYLGQLTGNENQQGLFAQAAQESAGPPHDPGAQRRYLLDIGASIAQGCLDVHWVFSENLHQRATVERLATQYQQHLGRLIEHCVQCHKTCYTPSDFPAVHLTQTALDAVLEETRFAIEGIYPLSPSQQGMYFESLAMPHSGIHVEQSTWQIKGHFNREAFEYAWQAVLTRHPVLRAAFICKTAQPLQVATLQAALPLVIEDLQGQDFATQKQIIESHLRQVRETGFDFTQPPLIKLGIFLTAEDEFFFCWSFHHILMDGWCVSLVLADLIRFYQSRLRDEKPLLARARPYWDYLTWLNQQDQEAAENFWRQQLAGLQQPTPLGVVSELDPPVAEPTGCGSESLWLSPELSAQLIQLTKTHRVSLNILCQAMWSCLLGYYGDTSRVVFGATVSGRPADLSGVESMVGLFINTLPIVVALQPDQSFSGFWQSLQAMQLERQNFEYCSAGQIQEWRERPKDLATAMPLYQSILVVENMPVSQTLTQQPQANAMQVLDVTTQGAQTNYPLVLMVMPGAQLHLKLIYNKRHFISEDAALILQQAQTVMQAFASSALAQVGGAKIGELQTQLAQLPKPVYYRATARSLTKNARNDYVAPRYDIELTLVRLWQEILGVKKVGVRDNFFALGGHSLLVLKLMKAIEQQFHQTLPIASVLNTPTIESLALCLRQSPEKTQWSPLVTIKQGRNAQDAAKTLFCFHPLGGNVLCYADLAQALPESWTVIGVQAPGIEAGQQPLQSLAAMTAYYQGAIQDAGFSGPYHLLGYSFGGYIALELAKQLRQAGETVALALLDTPAPTVISEKQKGDSVALLASLFPTLAITVEALQALLDEDTQLNHVIEKAKAAHFVPPEFGLTEAKRFFGVCKRNHFMPIPSTNYAGDVLLLRAREGAERISTDAALGWQALISGNLSMLWVAGQHETMLAAEYAGDLAQQLHNYYRECHDKTTLI